MRRERGVSDWILLRYDNVLRTVKSLSATDLFYPLSASSVVTTG
jgi:uncharacterized membrane protein